MKVYKSVQTVIIAYNLSLTFYAVDSEGIDILGIDILGIDIWGIDILAPIHAHLRLSIQQDFSQCTNTQDAYMC